MGGKRTAVVIVGVLLALPTMWRAAAAPPADAARRAADYLVSRQLPDGSWPPATGSAPATADYVADFVTALVSAGVEGAPVAKAADYVAAHGPTDANRALPTAQVVLAAVAAGKDPRDFGRVNYVGRLRLYYNPRTGEYDNGAPTNAVAILALRAAGETPPDHAIGALQGHQCPDGGFPRTTCLLGSDGESTALVLAALGSAGVGTSDPSVANGRTYLATAENPDGGFAATPGGPTSAEATGLAVSALRVFGDDPEAAPWKKSPTADPYKALVTLQTPPGGLRADTTTAAASDQATARALPGLGGVALPVRPAPAIAPPEKRGTPTPAAGATSTSVAKHAAATASRQEQASTSTTSSPVPPDSGKRDLRLAAPASRGGGHRSVLAALPLALTLFGAGTAGILLRRRARI